MAFNDYSSTVERSKAAEQRYGGDKSLYFCLVLENPFDVELLASERENQAEEVESCVECVFGATKKLMSNKFGNETEAKELTEALVETNQNSTMTNRRSSAKRKSEPNSAAARGCQTQSGFADDEFLLVGYGSPTRFQKVIEIIIRLEARGFDLTPTADAMLIARERAQLGVDDDSNNWFRGHSLNPETLIYSPDKDEMYIKIHGPKQTLLKYAERYGLKLRTNPLSLGGGQQMSYSKRNARTLAQSILNNKEIFQKEDPTATVPVGTARKSHRELDGFVFDVADKMRLVQHMIREPWEFGGCGIQVYEMRSKFVLVKHFFPLHNEHYRSEYGIDKWASLLSFIPCYGINPFTHSTENICKYFGEQIAMYFLWLREYTLFLPYIVVPGIICAALPLATDKVPKNVIHGGFAVACVFWGACWVCRWSRRERNFVMEYQQFDMVRQETVRDQFRYTSCEQIATKDIYNLNFEPPLTLRKGPNGFVNFHYPNFRRTIIRTLFSYPSVLVMTGALTAVQTLLTYWRFKNIGDEVVSYASSIIGVIASVFFSYIFSKLVELTNWLENPRTDTDEERLVVTKNFIFSFFSMYYSMFIIALYPTDANNVERLKELEVQMIIICVVKPMVQNIQELLIPYLKSKLRRRMDTLKTGYCGAICSILTCETTPDDFNRAKDKAKTKEAMEGLLLWREAQREPYETTAWDYLEITLQLGYMVMFATVFPWAPLCAFAYNIFEAKLDAMKLIRFSQRPIAKPCAGIGGWNVIIAVICGFSVITNSYLICVLSPAPDEVSLKDTDEWVWIYFVLLQYALVICCVLVYLLWGRFDPPYAEKLNAKQLFVEDEYARFITEERDNEEDNVSARRLAVDSSDEEEDSGSKRVSGFRSRPSLSPANNGFAEDDDGLGRGRAMTGIVPAARSSAVHLRVSDDDLKGSASADDSLDLKPNTDQGAQIPLREIDYNRLAQDEV